MEHHIETFEMNFRPPGYFGECAELLANILGDNRRELLRRAIERGEVEQVPELLFASRLDRRISSFMERLDPSHMGGEYLPDLLEGEVEIARVRLASVTGDVISVRARPYEGDILYRVVDEDGLDDHAGYQLPIARSSEPLSMEELVGLMDGADNGNDYGHAHGATGIVLPYYYQEWEAGDDLEAMRSFVRVRSEYYPELEAYYDLRAELWFTEVGGQKLEVG